MTTSIIDNIFPHFIKQTGTKVKTRLITVHITKSEKVLGQKRGSFSTLKDVLLQGSVMAPYCSVPSPENLSNVYL